MPNCPQCNKRLVELTRQCPSCRADLSLLVEYVNGLKDKLGRAEQLTRAGELGQAVWAYLEILEADPDNATARRQIGQVANAVRQFDRTKKDWAWTKRMLQRHRTCGKGIFSVGWLLLIMLVVAVILAFGAGFICGGGLTSAWS